VKGGKKLRGLLCGRHPTKHGGFGEGNLKKKKLNQGEDDEKKRGDCEEESRFLTM